MMHDKVIDKHSGYIIKNIEFDDSEGYDESGYKKVSRGIETRKYRCSSRHS